MKTKSEKTLPKITIEMRNGGIYIQKVRCGKNNCRCVKGAKHQAHYYFRRIRGKLRKQYVRKDQLEDLKVLLVQTQTKRKQLLFAENISKEIFKELSAKLREREGVLSSLKENGYE